MSRRDVRVFVFYEKGDSLRKQGGGYDGRGPLGTEHETRMIFTYL